MLSMTQAAKTIGRSKLTIMRDIKNGRLSAVRSDKAKGDWEIDPAELHRVYGNGSAVPQSDSAKTVEIVLLRGQLNDREKAIANYVATIDDLRRRLDREADERRETQAKLTALLTAPDVLITPPPPRRRWWKFGR